MVKRRRKRARAIGASRLAFGFGLRRAAIGGVAFAALAGVYAFGVGDSGTEIATSIAGLGDTAVEALGLTVEDVTVTGRHYTSAADILAALDVRRGEPITSIDVDAARERLLDLEWVRAASVSRFYPSTIHVEVDEHQPLARWQNDGSTVLIDERGAVVSNLDIRSFPNLPLVVGDGAAEAAPDFLPTLLRRPAIASRVHSALRIGDRRWSLRLDDGVIVHLPEEGTGLALDELVGLDERTGLLGRDVTTIDMRLPDRVTVMPAQSTGTGETDAAEGTRKDART